MTQAAATYMKRSQYAAHIGRSPGYITQLAAQGRVVFTPDGRFVDVAKTDALLAATADPAKQPVADRHAAARQAAADLREADDEVQRHLPPNEPDAGGSVLGYDFQLDRAKQQHFVAKKAEVEFLKEAKELCPRGDVVATFSDAGAAVRATVDTWAADLPPMLAGQTEAAIRQTLVDETERLLADLAARFHKLEAA